MFKLYFICFAALIFRTWRGIRKCLSKNKHKTKTHSIFKLFCHPMPYVIEKLQLHHANNKILCSEMRRPGHIYGTAKVHAEANSIILSRSAEWSAVYVLCWCMMYGHRCMFYVDVWCMVSGVCFMLMYDVWSAVYVLCWCMMYGQRCMFFVYVWCMVSGVCFMFMYDVWSAVYVLCLCMIALHTGTAGWDLLRPCGRQ